MALTTDEPPMTDTAPNLCPSPESVEAHQARIPRMLLLRSTDAMDARLRRALLTLRNGPGRTSEAVENAAWDEAAP